MRKLDHLETFVTVVEANSLALAAKQLGVSTAAISKQISYLEDDLKASLLRRTTRRLELTELGKIYYEHSKKVINKIIDIDAIMTSAKAEPSGTLKVLSSRYFTDRHIIPHLHEFLTKHPKVKLDLVIAGRAADLASEDIDLFFGIAHPPPPSFIQKEICKGYFCLCAAHSYLKRHGTPKHPQDLVHHQFITYSLRQFSNQLSFNNGSDLYIDPILSTSDMKVMIACALEGIGFIQLHQLEAEQYLSKGTLVEILENFKEAPTPIYLGYSQDQYLQPKVRCFVEFYLEKIKKESS